MGGKKETNEQIDPAAVSKTCFVMMPISNVEGYPSGHFAEVYKQLIEPAVLDAGFECELATSTSAAHMIQLEVVTKVATAPLCICDLSTNNPNVLFEYGIRQAFDLPTVLIKDDKTKRIFDLSGFRDIEYDHALRITNTLKARDEITKAISDTLAGSADEKQIFSLVKLMKMAKASLPTGELTKDDARFQLLEAKIDNLTSAITRDWANSSGAVVAPLARLFTDNKRVQAEPSTIFLNLSEMPLSDSDRPYISDVKTLESYIRKHPRRDEPE